MEQGKNGRCGESSMTSEKTTAPCTHTAPKEETVQHCLFFSSSDFLIHTGELGFVLYLMRFSSFSCVTLTVTFPHSLRTTTIVNHYPFS